MIPYGNLFQISLPPKQGYDMALADRWLNEVLRVPTGAIMDASDTKVPQRLARILSLTPVLLEMGQIPSFQPGSIVSCVQQKNGAFDAKIFIPHPGLIPEPPVRAAVSGSAEIIDWIGRNPLDEQNRQRLFSHIDNKIRGLVRPDFPVGKSTLHLLRAAHAMDIPLLHLGESLYQLGWGSRGRRFERSSAFADSAIGALFASDKVQTACMLHLAGLPAPRHYAVANLDEARHAASRLGWPLVVKPRDREGGAGVSVEIGTDDALKIAYEHARHASPKGRVIVERQVTGTCHRLFIAAGRLLYAVKRMPKSVCGDGIQTVRALVESANTGESALPPWLRSEPYPDDAEAVAAIRAAGLTWESVPGAGRWVPLRAIESTQWGGRDEEVTLTLHPDNLAIALAATRLLGLEVAGVDIISPDIARPWHENGAIINEVNYAPLLGGGAISRSHLPEFITRFIEADGRIPVEVVLGRDAGKLALERQRLQTEAGRRCFLVSESETLNDAGSPITFPSLDFSRRCLALLLNPGVEALVLHVSTDELLHRTLPVDRIDTLTDAGSALSSCRNPGQDAAPEQRQKLRAELLALCRQR